MRAFRGVLHILMSTQSSFITWVRHPGSIILIIAVVLMYVATSEQTRKVSDRSDEKVSSLSSDNRMPEPAAADSVKTASDAAPAKMGGELPRIVRQFSAPILGSSGKNAKKSTGAPSRLQAPDLSSLLGRLEDKVKAEPSNIGNRLLLAQTYNELGLGDKALEEVRAARKQDATHTRAKLVLASILSTRDNKQGLGEAKELLLELKSSNESKQYLVDMYLGDTFIRMGDHDAALSHWKAAVKTMPVTDNRRSDIEKRIADLLSTAK